VINQECISTSELTCLCNPDNERQCAMSVCS